MKILLTRRYAMSELLEIDVLRNFKRVEASGSDAVMNRCAWRARKFASVGFAAASSLLLVAFCVAPLTPVAQGQNQAGAATSGSGAVQSQSAPAAKPAAGAATQPAAASAQPPAQSSAQTSAQTLAAKSTDAAAQTSAQTEPQMQDQSAPPTESLGEAARRARAQKAKTATAKVYSDDSVSSLSGHGVSVVGDGKTGGGSSYPGNSYSGGGAQQGSAGNQESYWRGRANAIRAQMAACDQRISEIQDEIAKHGAVSVDPMSGAQAGVIFVEDRNAQIKQVENQKAGFERQLEELAEEGRKAGADSGWFR
jgi:hypothetical protein